jgi:site-specific recombinase XerD
MKGINEQDLVLRNKINTLLEQQPNYLRGFINFMNDSSTRTKYNYLVIILRFINKHRDVFSCSFDDYNNYLADIKYKENGDEQSKSYQIVTYSALKKFCEYLYKAKKIKYNYMDDIKRPKFSESQKTIEKRSIGYLDENEIKKMIKHSQDSTSKNKKLSHDLQLRNQAIIYLFLGTGIRCSALTSIDINDINLSEKTLTVTEKGNKIRHYLLSDSVCNAIELWLMWRKMDSRYPTDALFLTKSGRRMKSGDVSYVVREIAKYVTDKKISPHKLRATYGTQLYNKTGDIYLVQDCMGHNSPKTTELYIRDKKENTKKASDIMAKIMK